MIAFMRKVTRSSRLRELRHPRRGLATEPAKTVRTFKHGMPVPRRAPVRHAKESFARFWSLDYETTTARDRVRPPDSWPSFTEGPARSASALLLPRGVSTGAPASIEGLCANSRLRSAAGWFAHLRAVRRLLGGTR